MIKKIMNNTAVLYGLVGVANTIVGYGVMALLTFFGFIPEIANIIGYVVGIINSYFLNKKFTFKSKKSHKNDFAKFCIAMGIAYLANLVAFEIAYRIFFINEYISFIISNVVYTITGYLVSKFWVFKQNNSKNSNLQNTE